MKNIIKFNQMTNDKTYQAPLLVYNMTDRVSSKGKPFVSFELCDGEKNTTVNMWDVTVEDVKKKGIEQGCIVWFNITISNNNGTIYYNAGKDYHLNNDPELTVADFVPSAPFSGEKCLDRIIAELKKARDEVVHDRHDPISDLAIKLIMENEEAFKTVAAAVSMHHNYPGGLIYHTLRMVCNAANVCNTYYTMDKELLVSGAAIHDIGKIRCYETNNLGATNVTIEGRLLEHTITGESMIDEAAREGNYNPEQVMLLKHMIASHHGKLEWGAATTPAIPEAMMLNYLDMMDSRMSMFEEAYKGQEKGTISTARVYGLENSYIYKPAYEVVKVNAGSNN